MSSSSSLSIWKLSEKLLVPPSRFRKRNPIQGKDRQHYPAILAYVYRNRFCTAGQLQRRFPKTLPSGRTARRHLAELQESLQYLDLIPTPSPLWPKVYSVSREGLRKLRHASADRGMQWEPSIADRRRQLGYSVLHVAHELLVTEFLLNLRDLVNGRDDLELLNIERRSLARNSAFRTDGASQCSFVPDAFFMMRQKERGLLGSFLEVDTGSMSLKQVGEKLRRYSSWSRTARGQKFLIESYRACGANTPKASFRIIFVCGGKPGVNATRRAESIARIAQQNVKEIASHVWIASTNDFHDDVNPLKNCIWKTNRVPESLALFAPQSV